MASAQEVAAQLNLAADKLEEACGPMQQGALDFDEAVALVQQSFEGEGPQEALEIYNRGANVAEKITDVILDAQGMATQCRDLAARLVM